MTIDFIISHHMLNELYMLLILPCLVMDFTVLIEKILRTVPDVGKIYLLIKAKNKEAANERMKNEVSPIFM